MTTLCITAAVLFCIAGITAAFLTKSWSTPIAFLALPALYLTGETDITLSTIAFWGVAAAISWGIYQLLPAQVAKETAGTGYMTAAALAGTLVGLLVSQAGLIIGAVLGVFCGAMAFSRTPKGKPLEFPSRKFLNYLCAKGLPIVVTTSIAGIVTSILYIFYSGLK